MSLLRVPAVMPSLVALLLACGGANDDSGGITSDTKGTTTGTTAGITDGVTDGVTDGATDGITDGVTDGATTGTPAACPDPLAFVETQQAIGVASDGKRVFLGYKTNDGLYEIAAVPLAGGDPSVIVSGSSEITALAGDPSGLYYLALVNGFDLHKRSPDSDIDSLIGTVSTRATALALGPTDVYVAGGVVDPSEGTAEFFRVPKDGSSMPALVASAPAWGYPRSLSVGDAMALWSIDSIKPDVRDGRLWSTGIPGPSTIDFIGEAGDQADGYIIGTAASGALGFASVQITGGLQLWRFSPGDKAPTIVSEQTISSEIIADEAFVYGAGPGGLWRVAHDGSGPTIVACIDDFIRFLAQTPTHLLLAEHGGDPYGLSVRVVPK